MGVTDLQGSGLYRVFLWGEASFVTVFHWRLSICEKAQRPASPYRALHLFLCSRSEWLQVENLPNIKYFSQKMKSSLGPYYVTLGEVLTLALKGKLFFKMNTTQIHFSYWDIWQALARIHPCHYSLWIHLKTQKIAKCGRVVCSETKNQQFCVNLIVSLAGSFSDIQPEPGRCSSLTSIIILTFPQPALHRYHLHLLLQSSFSAWWICGLSLSTDKGQRDREIMNKPTPAPLAGPVWFWSVG